jgi:hypothetical protein
MFQTINLDYDNRPALRSSSSSTGPRASLPRALRTTLYWQHAFLALIHALSALGVLLVMLLAKNGDTTVPIVTARTQPGGSRTDTVLTLADARFHVNALCVVFALLASIDHTVCVVYWQQYTAIVAARCNYWRWIEYAASAPLMLVTIAIVSGILEATTLVLIFGHMMVTILFGWVLDVSHPNMSDQTLALVSVVSFVPYTFAWMPVYVRFFESAPSAPWFVWVIMITLTLLFACFALVHYRQVRGDDYEKGEMHFNVLSLLAKTSLTWLLVGGTISLNK